MDWLKLFTLLVAVASLCVTAEGAKKKIRIHLPQKVKHIHHHKKIYITNHPAPGHYAPAYMPSAEGAMAVPTSVALPPYSGVDTYEEHGGGAPSQLVPLYRARGYYGPQPSEFSNDYDLAPPPEPKDTSYLPQPPAFQDSIYSPKKNKVVKANNEPPRKKVSSPRKHRSKQRAPLKPQPQEDEHPVSNFHEQFYSDLDGSGTIKMIRRPHRVEKIIDGDTEHIHTYSEEHIHKLFYNDARDPLAGSMSGIAGHASPLGFRHTPAILAYPAEHLAALGSMGTPPHLEYMSYNPREVTHDHVFHDHGEIPSDVDITREQMLLPPKISYNSQGQLIRGGRTDTKHVKKLSQKYLKTPKVQDDYGYYESMYSPYNKHYTPPQPTNPTFYGLPNDQPPDGYNPSFNFRGAENGKTHYAGASPYFGPNKEVRDYGQQLSNAPSPFTMSSAIVHDYKPKPISRPSLTNRKKIKNPLLNFKNTNNLNDYNAYASSSNVHLTGDNTNNPFTTTFQGKRDKKMSFSRQNLSFGGMDHQTHVDHLAGLQFPAHDGLSGRLNSYSKYEDKGLNPATSTPYTIKESSPAHSYYSAMAAKALQETDPLSVGEASNDNFQFVAAPITSTKETTVATTIAHFDYPDNETETLPTETIELIEVRPMEMSVKSKKEKPVSVFDIQEKKQPHRPSKFSPRQVPGIPLSSGSLKYGDRI